MTRPVPDLIAVPYIGEFGWELMNWQASVRSVAVHSQSPIGVCGPPDRRALYADLIQSGRILFYPMPGLDWPGHANDDHRVDTNGEAYPAAQLVEIMRSELGRVFRHLGFDISECKLLTPDYRSSLAPAAHSHQSFINLRVQRGLTHDVVIVPRNRALALERNRPASWWDELKARLVGRGLRVATVEPRLDRAIAQFSSAKLAIGASTGGLHLASLCGCPHYVYGSGAEARWTGLMITNRQRYETFWNPLGTPCCYDECGWQPSMDHVIEGACRALETIGLRSERRPRPRRSWRIKRLLAQSVQADRSRLPWRVRNLIREHLV